MSRLAVFRGWRYFERRYIEVGGISRLAVYRGWWYIERRYIEVGGISRLVVYRGAVYRALTVYVDRLTLPGLTLARAGLICAM